MTCDRCLDAVLLQSACFTLHRLGPHRNHPLPGSGLLPPLARYPSTPHLHPLPPPPCRASSDFSDLRFVDPAHHLLVSVAMVFCTYCGQSFTRDEHLERHILTRTCLSPPLPAKHSSVIHRLTIPNRYQCQTVQMLYLPHVLCKEVCQSS